jgi:hypothetical protein
MPETILRKTIAILLLSLFIVNEFSYFTVFIPLKNTARLIQSIRINNLNEPDDLSVIKVNVSELYNNPSLKFLNESEIKYNDEMYDILDMTNKDGILYIYCLKDETENLIFKTYSIHFQNNPGRNFSLNFFCINTALKLIAYICPDNTGILITITEILTQSNFALKPDPYLDVDSPPPKYS